MRNVRPWLSSGRRDRSLLRISTSSRPSGRILLNQSLVPSNRRWTGNWILKSRGPRSIWTSRQKDRLLWVWQVAPTKRLSRLFPDPHWLEKIRLSPPHQHLYSLLSQQCSQQDRIRCSYRNRLVPPFPSNSTMNLSKKWVYSNNSRWRQLSKRPYLLNSREKPPPYRTKSVSKKSNDWRINLLKSLVVRRTFVIW